MERKANLLRKPDRKVKAVVAAGLGLLLAGCASPNTGEGNGIVTPTETTTPSGAAGFGEGPTTAPATHGTTREHTHPMYTTTAPTHPTTHHASASPKLVTEYVDNHSGAKVFEDNAGTALKDHSLPSVL